MQLLRPDESWLVGGMVERRYSSTRLHQAGPAFPHSAHCSNIAPTPTAQTHMASSNARFKETFQSFGHALCLCYFVPPPPKRILLEMWHFCVWKKYKLEKCQNAPSFSHYSHSNKTPFGPFPRDLTFCQPILYIRHAVEEIRGWPTLNPVKRSGGGMY